MLSRERLGNPNQRLIALTPELIQDMLEHESLEYQTPPGGHRRSSTNQKIADKLRRNQISNTKKQEKMNRKSMKKIDFKAEKSREKEKCLDAFLESVLMKSLDSTINQKLKQSQWNCSTLNPRQDDFIAPPVPQNPCPLNQDKQRKNYRILACIITMLCSSVGLTRS
ncbi:hypothetical protein ACLKA7_004616 [Drosophila subpalustris]